MLAQFWCMVPAERVCRHSLPWTRPGRGHLVLPLGQQVSSTQGIAVFASVGSWISLVPYIQDFEICVLYISLKQFTMDARFVWDPTGCDSGSCFAEHDYHSSSMPNYVYATAESFFPCLLMPGWPMPELDWLGEDRRAWEPAQQKPRLDNRPASEAAEVENGELVKVFWPCDAAPAKFGPRGTSCSFPKLRDEGNKQGIIFKMRHAPRRTSTDKKTSAQLETELTQPYLVQIAGPPGTIREFYADVRKLMATKRQSWAGLPHPRKLTVLTVTDWVVQKEMPAVGSAGSATATGSESIADDIADDTDEGEPPCDEDLVFNRMENLSTGGRLVSPMEVPVAEDDVQYPNQSAERDEEAHWEFHLLLDEAVRLLEVFRMHGA